MENQIIKPFKFEIGDFVQTIERNYQGKILAKYNDSIRVFKKDYPEIYNFYVIELLDITLTKPECIMQINFKHCGVKINHCIVWEPDLINYKYETPSNLV